MGGRRIKALLKLDATNTNAAQHYRITLTNVPTPMDATSGASLPEIMIPTLGTTTLKSRSAAGCYNVTYAGFGKNTALTFVKWSKQMITAKIGLYTSDSIATLMPDGDDAFFKDLSPTLTNTAFAFNPSTLKITGGD